MTKKKTMYNRVQIYNLDRLLLLDISCEKCIKQGYCSRSKRRRSHCEINDVVTKSGVFDIRGQYTVTPEAKYYVNTDNYENFCIARSAIQKIQEQYSR